MKWPKRKPGFKDEVLWKLNALHHLYIELNTRADKKEHKRTWKEPAKWKMDKLPDGKWQFEWEDTNRGGHGQLTGNFNQCLEGMKRFEFVLLEDTIPDASNAPVDNDSTVPDLPCDSRIGKSTGDEKATVIDVKPKETAAGDACECGHPRSEHALLCCTRCDKVHALHAFKAKEPDAAPRTKKENEKP